jgi:hypothetical protein
MIKEPSNVVELPMPDRGLLALKVAVKKAIEELAREGLPIYVSRDGHVVEIPPMNWVPINPLRCRIKIGIPHFV